MAHFYGYFLLFVQILFHLNCDFSGSYDSCNGNWVYKKIGESNVSVLIL